MRNERKVSVKDSCYFEFNEASIDYAWDFDKYQENIGEDGDDSFAFFLRGNSIPVLPKGSTLANINDDNPSKKSQHYIQNAEADGVRDRQRTKTDHHERINTYSWG